MSDTKVKVAVRVRPMNRRGKCVFLSVLCYAATLLLCKLCLCFRVGAECVVSQLSVRSGLLAIAAGRARSQRADSTSTTSCSSLFFFSFF